MTVVVVIHYYRYATGDAHPFRGGGAPVKHEPYEIVEINEQTHTQNTH